MPPPSADAATRAPAIRNPAQHAAIAEASETLRDITAGGLRSGNMLNSRDPADRQRQRQANRAISEGNRQGTNSIERAAHNCGHLSDIACQLLASDGHRPHVVTFGGEESDHTIVALGDIAEGYQHQDLHHWPAGVQLYDPLFDINCAAPDYPAQLQHKMQEMAAAGWTIHLHGQCLATDDRRWLDSIVNMKQDYPSAKLSSHA